MLPDALICPSMASAARIVTVGACAGVCAEIVAASGPPGPASSTNAPTATAAMTIPPTIHKNPRFIFSISNL